MFAAAAARSIGAAHGSAAYLLRRGAQCFPRTRTISAGARSGSRPTVAGAVDSARVPWVFRDRCG